MCMMVVLFVFQVEVDEKKYIDLKIKESSLQDIETDKNRDDEMTF